MTKTDTTMKYKVKDNAELMDRLAYVKPESTAFQLELQQLIATSGTAPGLSSYPRQIWPDE